MTSSSDVVTSLEAIRSKVLGVVHAVERETKDVATVYSKNPIDLTKVVNFVRSKKSLSEARNLEELGDRLMSLTVADDAELRQMRQLKRAVEKGMSFDYLLSYLCPQLRKAYDRYLRRYCLSFEREAGQLGLGPVIEYENNITKWKADIRDRFTNIGSILKEKSASEAVDSSVAHLLADQTSQHNKMTDACQSLHHICEMMKAWAMADFAYAHRLQDEINDLTHRREELKKTIKTSEVELERQKVKIKRQEFSTTQVRHVLRKVTSDKDASNSRLRALNKKLGMNDAQLTDLRKQLSELRLRLDEEGKPRIQSLDERDRLQDVAHQLRQRIRDLEETSQTARYELRSVQTKQLGNEKDADNRARALQTTDRQREKAKEEVERLDERLKGMRMERTQLGQQLVALRRIRDAKTDPQTLRHIQLYGYTPGMMTAAIPGEGRLRLALQKLENLLSIK